MNEDSVSCRMYDIYQIDPEKDVALAGQFIVVTRIYEWGIQGYLLLDTPDGERLVRFQGRAFIRKKWDEVERVGKARWVGREKQN